MAQPKYEVGELVRYVGDLPEEMRPVLSRHEDSTGWVYTIESQDVDVRAKKLLVGVKTVREDELTIEAAPEAAALEAAPAAGEATPTEEATTATADASAEEGN